MANFQYAALDSKGEQTTGVIAAASEQEAIQKLRASGYYPTQIVEEGKVPKGAKKAAAKTKGKAAAKSKATKSAVGGKVKAKNLMIFTRQLATLIDSGLPLLRSLSVLAKQEPNPVLKATVTTLADSVQGGSTFSESLSQHPRIFNKLYVNMVKAGELGGVLEIVLNRLAEYQEKAAKLKNKIVSAMVYPVIVMFIAVCILVFLMIFIVPKFKDMFAEMGNEKLPLISRIVFGASEFFIARPFFLPNAVFIFVFIGLLVFLYNMWGKTKGGRQKIDTMKLRMPIFGDIQRKSAVSRFSRTLGTLVTSGVPILQALNITRDTAGNVIISQAIEKVHEAVKEGESIVSPLQACGVFPDMVISMVDVGEETGQLPEMLLKVADVFDDEVDNAVTALTSILEPIMIVFLALVVGSVVFALFLPLIKVIGAMGEQT
ncbi:type II secretion system F family protein [Luteolibacter pohnpeiensis]|uniref:Type II secretion system F family protein n=1 Tax=Luteolibacter pohnpeiensis TaxID=454153 RepID=A0A934S7V2_9BACT|nr:type II secretion system F family protein [Luteolibacter pohnpeiensis]MBK1883453.1 type II secretion system F family protein [Luteolibacter pohnpeiensis]